MKKISILGSTGSIGKNTLKVAEYLSDTVQVVALAARSNIDLLEEQILKFKPQMAAVYDPTQAKKLQARGLSIPIISGLEGLEEVACFPSADLVMVASDGIVALKPTVEAILAKKQIALANKELLVAAGEFLMTIAKRCQTQILPVDSEHSAIFQCLQGETTQSIHRIILTASGGPFYRYSESDLKSITPEQALNHPRWQMGPKITVDCSTLMNKGFEAIEAKWLFDVNSDQIDIVIHPQSLIHSMVEFSDGSIKAQLSEPNMVYPIQYAMTYPERKKTFLAPFDFSRHHCLDFFPPDEKRFPALTLTKYGLKRGGSYLTYLNAANQVLVDRFLKKEISWLEIVHKLQRLMEKHNPSNLDDIGSVFAVDEQARMDARGV